MRDFTKLKVWEKAHALALDAFKATNSFPRHQLYTLTSQLQRAAISIPTNIAEGCGRGTDADFGRFLTIAMGSASEVEYLLLFSRDVGYLSDAAYERLFAQTSEIKRMLTGFLARLADR
ncbi:MAG: four helix bundle protein [Planctomycetes bacterium]|nr:four helix bundle protein [Planctomycetota bacterium]